MRLYCSKLLTSSRNILYTNPLFFFFPRQIFTRYNFFRDLNALVRNGHSLRRNKHNGPSFGKTIFRIFVQSNPCSRAFSLVVHFINFNVAGLEKRVRDDESKFRE